MNELQEQMRKRWDEKGWDYDQAGAHGIHNEDEKARWIAKFKELPAAADVLDVGTGTGFVALLAAERGHRVTGIDWSVTMLTQARAKADQARLNIAWVEGMTESLPFENETFDVVTARHVLWTLSAPGQALAEWHRVLKPGGKVWADFTPRTGGHHGQHYSEEVEERLPLNKDIPPATIEDLFRGAGFADVRTERWDRPSEHHPPRTTWLFTAFKKS